MDEKDVQFIRQPSFKCSNDFNTETEPSRTKNNKNKELEKSSIFMIVMTLSAPKNFEARNFVRKSIEQWTKTTSRSEGNKTFFTII